MEHLLIRPVLEKDLPELQQIANSTFLDTFGPANKAADMAQYAEEKLSLAHISKEWANPGSKFFFSELAGNAIGYLKVNTGSAQTEDMLPAGLEIERIYVQAEYLEKTWVNAYCTMRLNWLRTWVAPKFGWEFGKKITGRYAFIKSMALPPLIPMNLCWERMFRPIC